MPDWGVLLGVLGEMPLLQAVLWLVAAGVLIGLIVKSWPFFKNSVQIVDALLKLPSIAQQIPELAQQVKQIHHETHKNDGSSLKDSNDRVEETVARIEKSVEGLHGRLDTVEKDVGGIRQETRTLREVDLDQGRKVDGLDGKLDRHLAETSDLIDYVRQLKEKNE